MRFCCPSDLAILHICHSGHICPQCKTFYPTIRNTPILINEQESVFSIHDYLSGASYDVANRTGDKIRTRQGLRRIYIKLTERLQWAHLKNSYFDAENALQYINETIIDANILIIGAGMRRYSGHITYTDVAFSDGITCICDAHNLPFEASSFDAVIASAVLEHVIDPTKCVAEIQRVLKIGGYVYALTPFMQPVHMREHDYTRWSYLGHRRLFRWFDDINSGVCGGPGSSAALMFRHLLLSLSSQLKIRPYLRLLGLLLSFPMLQLDRISLGKISSYDAACGVYFFGTLRDHPWNDRAILAMYRGAD